MAKFNGATLPFDWYLGADSFEEAGFNLSKSYENIENYSSNNLTTKGSSNIWGNDYQTTASYNLVGDHMVSSVIKFKNGKLDVSDIQGITISDLSETDLDRFNDKYLRYNDEIIASKNNDYINSRDGDDFVRGNDGDDILIGGNGDDLIVGGKGFDYLEGGKGADRFGVSKKLGKGKKNYDFIADFEAGKDAIFIYGSSKSMWIDNYQGDSILVRGKSDVIAWIEGTGGQLDWSDDGTWIM
jgi:Ca2+-binding RTX toxin-like protein